MNEGRVNQERLMKVLLAPVRTEKSHRLADEARQITFKVLPDATKTEIRKAVKLMFDVDVTEVRTVNCRGKRARFGKSHGWHNDWKKAYVTLAEGQDIDFATSESA